MMVVMTEATPDQPGETTAAAEPARRDGRWDKSHRRGGRPFRLAALVIALAGIVFIIAVIFWSGFILGASEGGHHHGHGGGGSSEERGGAGSNEERDGSKRDNGMPSYGVVIVQTVPTAGVPA
jgi:hypothetical protein